MQSCLNILAVLVVMAVCCHGYSLGPPIGACPSMFPTGHNATAMTIDPPFNFTLNATTYSPGDVIEVFLEAHGQDNGADWFMEGALIQVRSTECSNDKAVGTFQVQQDDVFLKTMNCFGQSSSALAHYSHLHIFNRTFYWTAPSTASGHLYIRATIARNQEKFWTNVFSDYILDSSVSDSTNLDICPVQVSASVMVVPTVISFLISAVVSFYMSWN